MCSGRGTCISVNDSDPWLKYDCSDENLFDKHPCSDVEYQSENDIPNNTYCRNLKFLRMRHFTDKVDFRYNWPAQIFTHICKCSGNYAGYDCSRCKPGYTGSNCEQKRDLVERKNFLKLSDEEKRRVIDAFNIAKHHEEKSMFTIPIEEEPQDNNSFKLLPLYDIFATFHYYTIKDNDFYIIHSSIPDELRLSIPDFGHEGPGFLPWHRAYLLSFETEMQYMLDEPSFTLPYWDWTSVDSSDIFQKGLFGSCNCTNKSEPVDIISDHFSNWSAVCTEFESLTKDLQSICE